MDDVYYWMMMVSSGNDVNFWTIMIIIGQVLFFSHPCGVENYKWFQFWRRQIYAAWDIVNISKVTLWTVLLHKCVANVLLYICVCRRHGDGRLVLIVPEDIHSYLKVNVRWQTNIDINIEYECKHKQKYRYVQIWM